MNYIFKIKRKDGTFSVIALQFNDYNSIRLVVLKGSNPFYNEVFSIIFSYTNIITRVIKEKLKRVFHSKVCIHNGMSATYLWIEYGQMKPKIPDDFTDFTFKDIILGIQRTGKLQISGENKLDGFTFYILDLIDFALELKILKFENGVISKGANYVEVDVDIIQDKTFSFISADTKNEIYRAIENWEFKSTSSVSEEVSTENEITDILVGDFVTCNICSENTTDKPEVYQPVSQYVIDVVKAEDETKNEIFYNHNGVALNGEDTTEFDNQDETVFSDTKEYGLTEREILLCDEYSETLSVINESHLPPSYFQYVIDRCVSDIDKHTECYEEDITFLKKCNIEKYNGQIKAIIEKNNEIKDEISSIIDNIIESDMREDAIVRSMIDENMTHDDETEDEIPSNMFKITLNN